MDEMVIAGLGRFVGARRRFRGAAIRPSEVCAPEKREWLGGCRGAAPSSTGTRATRPYTECFFTPQCRDAASAARKRTLRAY